MFTGLIESVGTIRRVQTRRNYRLLTIQPDSPFDHLQKGESICIDGACLTVTEFDQQSFVVEASQETIERTVAGQYTTGYNVNLERALRADSRLGGHLVSGHVDTRGALEYLRQVGDSWELAVTYDSQYDPLVVEKGSIAVDGISLTVNEVSPGRLTVNVIPHTYGQTTIRLIKPGRALNLEFDMIGKYIIKASRAWSGRGVTLDKLTESGW